MFGGNLPIFKIDKYSKNVYIIAKSNKYNGGNVHG